MADLTAGQIPIYANVPKTNVGVLNAATAGALNATTNAITVYTAGSQGAIIDSLVSSSTDTAAVNLFVFIVGSDGTTVKNLFQVNIPIGAGNSASVLNVDCLDPAVSKGAPIDNNGKRIIRLAASETLRVSTVANMTAAKICTVTAMAADFQA